MHFIYTADSSQLIDSSVVPNAAASAAANAAVSAAAFSATASAAVSRTTGSNSTDTVGTSMANRIPPLFNDTFSNTNQVCHYLFYILLK